MPHLTGNRLPKYRKHASVQAIVSLDGRYIYLGPHGYLALPIDRTNCLARPSGSMSRG